VDVRVKNFALLWIPLPLIYLCQLAIFLSFADYMLDALLNSLRCHISVKRVYQLDLLA
jgi:hypothetical protein